MSSEGLSITHHGELHSKDNGYVSQLDPLSSPYLIDKYKIKNEDKMRDKAKRIIHDVRTLSKIQLFLFISLKRVLKRF